MAWTLHLLVGITVITASAYKCKQTPYSDQGSDRNLHYNFPSQEPIEIPDNRAYDRMNARSSQPSSFQSSVPDDVQSAQLRIAEPQTRSENESKVLNRKLYIDTRRGENSDKIVFPGPTSKEYKLEIPPHCKRLGICEDVANYPQEEVDKVLAELPDKGTFQNDKLDMPDVPDIAQRVGPQEDNIELCSFQEKVVYPKAAVDPAGNWHIVLNQENNPVQGFKVEICDADSLPCSDIALFQDNYKASCKQKYVYRKMAVLENGAKIEKSLKVPSCCSCVARLVLQY